MRMHAQACICWLKHTTKNYSLFRGWFLYENVKYGFYLKFLWGCFNQTLSISEWFIWSLKCTRYFYENNTGIGGKPISLLPLLRPCKYNITLPPAGPWSNCYINHQNSRPVSPFGYRTTIPLNTIQLTNKTFGIQMPFKLLTIQLTNYFPPFKYQTSLLFSMLQKSLKS